VLWPPASTAIMPKKKSFVDKKNAVTYRLFARDTQGGDGGPSISFARTDRNYNKSGPLDEQVFVPGEDGEEYGANVTDAERREMLELGLAQDGYNYLQHLRTIDSGPSGVIKDAADAAGGSRAFIATQNTAPNLKTDIVGYDASFAKPRQEVIDEDEDAEKPGLAQELFERAKSRQLHDVQNVVDPEIGAILDSEDEEEGWNSQGELNDDFVIQAQDVVNGPLPDSVERVGEEYTLGRAHGDFWTPEAKKYREQLLEQSFGGKSLHDFADEDEWFDTDEDDDDTQKPDNDAPAATLLDEQFEKLALEYDDDEIGELEPDMPEASGAGSLAQYENVLDDFLRDFKGMQYERELEVGLNQMRKEKRELMRDPKAPVPSSRSATSFGQRSGATSDDTGANIHAEEGDDEYESEKEVIEVFESDDEREKWDCETIVSTYSNMENHPALIREDIEPRKSRATQIGGVPQILLSRKTGLPLGVLPTRSKKAQIIGHAVDKTIQERKKNESKEEKKARKDAVKAARREARANKKALKVEFNREHARQQGQGAPTPSQVPL